MYLVSAACYEHRALIGSAERRSELEAALIHGAAALEGVQVDAWVVLPNHYHVLVECDFNMFRGWIGRLHNRKATQWNREDGTPGRKVWYRFLDRAIRSERHYYASLNYVHANPVKHGWVSDATEWRWSSLGAYLEVIGRDELAQWWRKYPVDNYGRGWDD